MNGKWMANNWWDFFIFSVHHFVLLVIVVMHDWHDEILVSSYWFCSRDIPKILTPVMREDEEKGSENQTRCMQHFGVITMKTILMLMLSYVVTYNGCLMFLQRIFSQFWRRYSSSNDSTNESTIYKSKMLKKKVENPTVKLFRQCPCYWVTSITSTKF